MRRASRASATAVLAVLLVAPRVAHATSVEEFPDNGSEQEGRGGAWVARASDPLATFYNPAGLAGQPTRLTLQVNVTSQHTCFTRVKATNDTTDDGVQPGGTYPKVCSSGGFFPDPQLAFTYRVSSRVGVGIAVLAPSAAADQSWPSFVGNQPAPQRYLLLSSSAVVLTPTIGIGWEVADGFRIGAAFVAGLAPSIELANSVPALDGTNSAPQSNDIRSDLKAKDLFIPGFTLGAIWSPSSELDVAAWYKWMAPINAKGDVTTESNFFSSPHPSNVEYGDTSEPYCYTLPAGQAPPPGPPPCGSGNNASVKIPIPMEAKLGVRYHKIRDDVPYDPHLRDPMAQDVFDVEADFTWANDSAFDYLEIHFPGTSQGIGTIPANPAAPSAVDIPPNADVRHHFRDVVGARVGGDYNILPDRLALRAGAFFETQAADSVYQNIDFDGADRFGIAAGGTYRIHVGAEQKQAVELMLGYGHVFFGTLSNDNPSSPGLPALTGTVPYRTSWAANLGTITSSINVINAGASYKF